MLPQSPLRKELDASDEDADAHLVILATATPEPRLARLLTDDFVSYKDRKVAGRA